LRTSLWRVPTVMVAGVVVLFVVTYTVDRAADTGWLTLPSWVESGGADAVRQVLIAIAAAVITVAGVVFSVTILALQLASQQFGPRMLRNFIRDLGTQITLGTFVSTFVFSMLALGSVGNGPRPDFVPHLSATVAIALTLVSMGVLIYFIDHVATSIQLTSVVSGIAHDFDTTVEELFEDGSGSGQETGPSLAEVSERLEREGAIVPATTSGYLQAVGRERLISIASSSEAVIRLLQRPGHFLVEGRPLALVWPAAAAPAVTRALERAHVVGSYRTLTQDPGFAIDQLVEISLRALSPAVNDTFTALNCIDWLGDGLSKVAARPLPDGIHRGDMGTIRVIEPAITFDRLVKGAFDKVRQAGRGMPAVYIRQLENLAKILDTAASAEQAELLARQADMILRASEESVPEPSDRLDVSAAHDGVRAARDRAVRRPPAS